MCQITDGFGDLYEVEIHGCETTVKSALFYRWPSYSYFLSDFQLPCSLMYTQKMN